MSHLLQQGITCPPWAILPLPTGCYFIHTLLRYTSTHNNGDNLVSPLYDIHIRAFKTDMRMRVAISCDPLLQ